MLCSNQTATSTATSSHGWKNLCPYLKQGLDYLDEEITASILIVSITGTTCITMSIGPLVSMTCRSSDMKGQPRGGSIMVTNIFHLKSLIHTSILSWVCTQPNKGIQQVDQQQFQPAARTFYQEGPHSLIKQPGTLNTFNCLIVNQLEGQQRGFMRW